MALMRSYLICCVLVYHTRFIMLVPGGPVLAKLIANQHHTDDAKGKGQPVQDKG